MDCIYFGNRVSYSGVTVYIYEAGLVKIMFKWCIKYLIIYLLINFILKKSLLTG